MTFVGVVVCALLGVGDAGGPPHPRLLFHPKDLAFLQQNLGDAWYQESWAIVKGYADNPKSIQVNQNYTFTDIFTLYGGPLNVDTDFMINAAVAYGLTGQQKYAAVVEARMDNVVNRIDPSYRSGLNWWDSIQWDLLGVRMVLSLDLVWNDLSAAQKQAYATWCGTLCDSIDVLHTADMNNGYYPANDCGGNIKSWDNALFGLTGFLVGDPVRIRYALTDPANGTNKNGSFVAFPLQEQLRDGTVEVSSGTNSQYGTFRTVDWIRAVDDGKPYNEAIGYQCYHQEAVELLMRGALRHGVDYYRFAGRAAGTDGRHHMVDPVERTGDFTALVVPAVDNEWRTWSGSNWYYSSTDKYQAGVLGLKQAGFADEVRTPRMDTVNARLDGIISAGLQSNNEYDAEWHVLRYTWPLLRVNRVRGRPAGGTVTGQVGFETAPPATPGQVQFVQLAHPELGYVETPVELDADGAYDVHALDPGRYYLLARAAGQQTALASVQVVGGQTVNGPALVLPDGAHSLAPASQDYLTRAAVPKVRLTHVDPDGIDPGSRMHLYLVFRGLYFDLLQLTPKAFDVVRSDAQNLLLDLDLTRLRVPGQEVSLWWVVLTPQGDILADHARYRFVD